MSWILRQRYFNLKSAMTCWLELFTIKILLYCDSSTFKEIFKKFCDSMDSNEVELNDYVWVSGIMKAYYLSVKDLMSFDCNIHIFTATSI